MIASGQSDTYWTYQPTVSHQGPKLTAAKRQMRVDFLLGE